MFSDVADAMAEAKCDFVGRATLHENIAAAAVPPEMVALLDEAGSIRIRETMQDIAAATPYRRDIYRRGLAFMPVAEHRSRLEAMIVAGISAAPLSLPGWPGSGLGDAAFYRPLIQALLHGKMT